MKKTNFSSVKRVLKYIKKYTALLIFSILLSIATVACTLYIPIVIGQAIDKIVGKGAVDFDVVIPLLVRVVIISLVIAVLQWIMNTINNKITYNVTRDVRREAFDKLGSLPLSYIDSHPSGEIVSRIISDVDQLAEGLLMGFTQFFTGIATIIGTLIFMLTLSPLITLVVVVLTPLSLVVAGFISKSTYSLFKIQSEARARQTAIINESIGNLKVVKAFSHEDESLEKFDKSNDKLKKASVKAIFFSSLVNPTTRFINALVYAGVALVGALIVMGNLGAAITVGTLSCFLSYANQYAKPFNEISGVVTELQNALACATRVFELIDEKPEAKDKENALVLKEAEGDIDLENVEFSYVPEKPLIKNLNLKVRNGQRIAIVGPTGCGKTTLINLLMRFYDVCAGSISIDGTNIKDITRHSLRKNYGMVLQDTWLMGGTVKENIAIGKPDASDEATSSIDTRTELKIQEAFASLMSGRTSFIVAHRLSTIKEADLILVMNKGNIVETGSHQELLDKKGFYYNLYHSQFEHSEEL